MGDSGAVASPDSSGESGGTGDARAAAEDVAALSSEGESGVVGRSTASVKSCVLVSSLFPTTLHKHMHACQ